MATTRRNLILTLALLVGLIFGCILLATTAQQRSQGNAPIRGLTITIDESHRDELFTQLRKFAEKHRFEFHLDFYDSNRRIFLVSMYGHDLKMLAADVPKAPAQVRLDFYLRDPPNSPPEATVDELFNDLKHLISEIPDATISDAR